MSENIERKYVDSSRPDVAQYQVTIGNVLERIIVPPGRYLLVFDNQRGVVFFRVIPPSDGSWVNELPAYQGEPLVPYAVARVVDVPARHCIEWIGTDVAGLAACPVVLFPEDHNMGVK